jgi:GGDEF domain-containing protein
MTIQCQTTEARRLDALRKLNLLDTPPSEAFDRITRMAARLFDLPIAAVSLTDSDRQWFKSRVGVAHDTIPRLRAPCGEIADASTTLVIPDLLDDAFFRDSPLAASGIRYYAGAPLITTDGHCLGAMCVLGTERRDTTAEEVSLLIDLAAMVMAQIEMMHAIGRIDPVSGLPNRNQFIDDFEDLQNNRPDEPRLAVLVNLATPEQLANAVHAMHACHVDDFVSDAASRLRAAVGAGRQVYHVTTTQFALLAPAGATLGDYLPMVQADVMREAATIKSRFVATPTVGIVPFDLGGADALNVLRQA